MLPHTQAWDGGDCASSGFEPSAWHGLTGHLSDAHCAFFTRWWRLLELEESGARGRRHALWAVRGGERDAPGLCMSQLRLVVSSIDGGGALSQQLTLNVQCLW